MSITKEQTLAAQPSASRGHGVHLSYDAKSNRIAYAANKSIFLRSVENPAEAREYTLHSANTTVAKFSPSGFYVASADAAGNVKIWDAVGEDMVTKGEYQVISGPVKDLEWDAGSQRIIAVGDGKEKFGHCFTWDSGNTVGEISGHSDIVNAVTIRPVRPYRAATVSDDNDLVFYHGPPFRFQASSKGKHNNFVHDVRYSPDGEYIVSVGADRKINIYEGKSGEHLDTISSAHEGGIFAVAWSQDSKKFATASGDCTVKLWDIASKEAIHSWKFAKGLDYSQVGVVFTKDGTLLSLSLNGELNYLKEGADTPEKTVYGHQKSITALAVSNDKVFTGSYDGTILGWDLGSLSASPIGTDGHKNLVVGIVSDSKGTLWSTAWDDTLRSFTSKGFESFSGVQSQAKAISSFEDTVVLAYENSVQTLVGGKVQETAATNGINSAISAVDISSGLIVVGEGNAILSFSTSLKDMRKFAQATYSITYLSFSPDGKYLASGDSSGKITLYSVAEKSVVTNRWAFHNSTITSIDWHPSGNYVVAGSIDSNLIVYSVEKPSKNIKFLGAHKGGVSAVGWISQDKFVSAGSDASVKLWNVKF